MIVSTWFYIFILLIAFLLHTLQFTLDSPIWIIWTWFYICILLVTFMSHTLQINMKGHIWSFKHGFIFASCLLLSCRTHYNLIWKAPYDHLNIVLYLHPACCFHVARILIWYEKTHMIVWIWSYFCILIIAFLSQTLQVNLDRPIWIIWTWFYICILLDVDAFLSHTLQVNMDRPSGWIIERTMLEYWKLDS